MRIRIKTNTISKALQAKLKEVKDMRPALQAAATVVTEMTKRAFNEPALRPTEWAELKPATLAEKKRKGKSLAILKRDGLLVKSPRVADLTDKSVTVTSDRPYAAVQQLGNKKGTIPARPFFPFSADGKPTPKAVERVEIAIKAVLNRKS
jgi:phage gpG-like protein